MGAAKAVATDCVALHKKVSDFSIALIHGESVVIKVGKRRFIKIK